MTTIVILLCIGLFAGVLSGMVGIGGGIIIVPALVYFMNMSQPEAQGTSLAVLLLPVGILAVYFYYQAGYVDVRSSLIIATTFVIGGFIGSKIAIVVDQNMLKKIFGIFLFLISLKMIFGK
ncbi:MAG: sulfite exporter TauE/SafE family protein [Bacteroidetes bacterium]|nr:sulfite exporter TauE/SafE family protein [Bacteroidota bacterium]